MHTNNIITERLFWRACLLCYGFLHLPLLHSQITNAHLFLSPSISPFFTECKLHAGLKCSYILPKKFKLHSFSNSLSSRCTLCGWCSAQRALLFHGIELDPEWPFYNEWIENVSLWNAACRHWLGLFFSSLTPPSTHLCFDELKGQYPHPPHLRCNAWLSKDRRSIMLPL